MMSRFWIVVAAQDHAHKGRDGGFVQANHGKLAPMRRMQPGDGVVIYSPVVEYRGVERLQAFTAIGRVKPGEPYQGVMGGDFVAYRRDVAWEHAEAAPIRPMLEQLSFTRGITNWGQRFRFGLFEIPEQDFEIISAAMDPKVGQ